MMTKTMPRNLILLTIVLGNLLFACASPKFLKVHYRLPAQSEAVAGPTVSLSVKDMRPNQMFLTANAKKGLRDFSDTFSLVVSQENKPGDLLGVYDAPNLFLEIFKRRLENAGITVLAGNDQANAEIVIGLKTFMLDLKDRKWILTLNYQTDIIKEQRIASTQGFSGSAERLRVVGAGEAEKIIGDLLTDMINKLDLEKLFRDAGYGR